MRPAPLLLAAVLALLARGSLFSEGGTVGAWASVVVFWVCLAAFLGLSLADAIREWRGGDRTPAARVGLVAVLVGAVVLGTQGGSEGAAAAATLLVLLGVGGLIALALRERRITD
jgi:hypothetical protein